MNPRSCLHTLARAEKKYGIRKNNFTLFDHKHKSLISNGFGSAKYYNVQIVFFYRFILLHFLYIFNKWKIVTLLSFFSFRCTGIFFLISSFTISCNNRLLIRNRLYQASSKSSILSNFIFIFFIYYIDHWSAWLAEWG